MKILVFGAGALGSFIGGFLSTKHDVTLLGRKEHISAVKRKGLEISGITRMRVHPRAVENVREAHGAKFDLIIMTVKSYDTHKAAKQLKKVFGGDSLLLSVQNGLSNMEEIAKVLGRQSLIGGVTSHGITFIGPGKIRHAGKGDTVIGSLDTGSRREVAHIASSLTSVGIETRVTENIMGEIWAKVIVNSAINPLTALTRLENGYLLRIPELEELLESVCREGIEVAEKCGVRLPSCDIIEKTKQVASRTAGNRSSMLQDMERGRRSEIEAISGALVKLAAGVGVPAPINSTLHALVKAMEKSCGRDLGDL